MNKENFTVVLFYKFIEIRDPDTLMNSQRALCDELGLKGRVIIAKEGINGTLEGTTPNIKKYLSRLKKDRRFSNIGVKQSQGTGECFPKLKIKVRDEIVTLGAGDIHPCVPTAKTVSADTLQKMYDNNDDFIVLDLRNDYEIVSGAFKDSIDPGLKNFRDLPKKISKLIKYKNKKVVTVCTGGIRCEKATKFMKKKGFKNLYQLQDGIHTYVQKYPGRYFKGTLYVFDNRMVTDVTKIKNKEVIGMCTYCGVKTEQYYSDDSTRPSTKVLSCTPCYKLHKSELREAVSA